MIVAVEKETQLEVWLEENMPEPGSGNPNTVDIYTGTTANVMSNISDLRELIAGITAGDITATLTLPGIQATVAGITIAGGLLFGAVFFADSQDDGPTAGAAYFYTPNSVAPLYGKILYNGQWIDAGPMNCVLTIIRHPLPEN